MTSKGDNFDLSQQTVVNSSNTEKLDVSLKAGEIEKMVEVKNILISNWAFPLSLKELAHKVGTNEFHLKKHFKMVFGSTVFKYLYQYKMERAKEMLTLQDLSIGEIAQKLGFKHATHFTASFKKHVGFLPRQYKTRDFDKIKE